MGKTIITSGLPPRWGVQLDRGAAGSGRILWFGAKRIAFDDIQSVAAEEVRERPVAGLLMGANVFMFVAMILAFGVYEIGWRERFLLGTLFLSFLGCAGLYEVTKIGKQRFFEIKIATGSQGVVTFASADPIEVDALMDTLAGAGVPV